MKDINQEIRRLGENLKGHLAPDIVDFDLEYIDYSKSILASETLCDHIADYDVVITSDEYKQIVNIVNKLNLELDDRYLYINPENIK
ncbi:MafI family immunity protein [Moellerella wisconsensis]|uniref:MafI family immunity protein n=1 Tax=Moellerella wisconsensis TaxID=158849 RepID=A0A9Q8V581_9GAMM|nr:MafI family immunity protein [Moellerella wisconsensis]UNH31386.1 MafI family immunity protein [Moellerella wisconsensis]